VQESAATIQALNQARGAALGGTGGLSHDQAVAAQHDTGAALGGTGGLSHDQAVAFQHDTGVALGGTGGLSHDQAVAAQHQAAIASPPPVQESAATIQALSQAAGAALLRAAQTGEVGVREQAMRAIVMIQPPETTQAFAAAMKDASADVRMVASAGWMKAAAVPADVISALAEAWRASEVQVRSNAAPARARQRRRMAP